MSRARILADYVSSGDELALKAPKASPAFTGTVDLTGTTLSLDDDQISGDKVSGGTIGAGTLGGSSIVNTSGAITTTGAFTSIGIDDNASGAVAITIDSDEKVGIGSDASTPLGKLHVASANSSATANANADELVIEGSGVSGLSILSGTSSTGNIYFGDSGNNATGAVIYDHSTSRISFMTAEAIRLYITDYGGVNGTCAGGSTPCLSLEHTHASFGGELLQLKAYRGGSQDSYSFIQCWSDTDGSAEAEFKVRNTGATYNDAGVWNTGADYAEYFEWKDGNPSDEDRAGMTVVLDGDKIRKANEGETPIGVVSANPAVVGDSAWNKWSQKYLKDDFGREILEEYTNSQGDLDKKAKLNSDFDDKLEYVPREDRQEWDVIGLVGKLRILKDQPVADSWIKMKDVSETVEMWFVK